MCCFSGNVNQVADTSIFCRMGAKGNQVVIYSMTLDTDEDVAMILPIPIREDRDEKRVEFLNLALSPKLFEKLDRAFPEPGALSLSLAPFGGSDSRKVIEVHSVGSFDASFVPTVGEKAVDVRMPERTGAVDGRIVAPAEVELP